MQGYTALFLGLALALEARGDDSRLMRREAEGALEPGEGRRSIEVGPHGLSAHGALLPQAAESPNDIANEQLARILSVVGPVPQVHELWGKEASAQALMEIDASADVSVGASLHAQRQHALMAHGRSLGTYMYRNWIWKALRTRDPTDGAIAAAAPLWANEKCAEFVELVASHHMGLQSGVFTDAEKTKWKEHCAVEATQLAVAGGHNLTANALIAAVNQTPVSIGYFEELADTLKKMNSSGTPAWRAKYVSWMKDFSWADFQLDLGLVPTAANLMPAAGVASPMPHKGASVKDRRDPDVAKGCDDGTSEECDARALWPRCAPVISHAKEQHWCASCWAFAVTTVAENRLCVSTNASFSGPSAYFSAGYVTGCAGPKLGQQADCAGGNPEIAFSFFGSEGAPTGGSSSNLGTCVPYFTSKGSSTTHFEASNLKTPTCDMFAACTEKTYPRSLEQDKFKLPAFSDYVFLNGGAADAFQQATKELRENGPIVIGFAVYPDFMFYSGGVYQCEAPGGCTNDKIVGYHATTAFGYGKDYLLGMNTWGANWGSQGAFRIHKKHIVGYWYPTGDLDPTGTTYKFPLPNAPTTGDVKTDFGGITKKNMENAEAPAGSAA